MPRTQSILVVDDELDIVAIFRQALSKYGYAIFGFGDLTLALEQFKSNVKDCALLMTDVGMPQMDGFEARGKRQGDQARRENSAHVSV